MNLDPQKNTLLGHDVPLDQSKQFFGDLDHGEIDLQDYSVEVGLGS